MTPENTLTISAVASAKPSISPTTTTLTPSVPTMNSGSRLWIISDEMSISKLTKPSTQMPAGSWRRVVVGEVGREAESGGGGFMRAGGAGPTRLSPQWLAPR